MIYWIFIPASQGERPTDQMNIVVAGRRKLITCVAVIFKGLCVMLPEGMASQNLRTVLDSSVR